MTDSWANSPRITAITLGVRDVAAAKRFYVEGLGWPALWEAPGEIVFVQVAAGQMLALWNVASMPREYGPVAHPPAGGPAVPMSLGRNVASPEEVDREIARALAAGATLVKAAARQAWGGSSGCFADPDGFLWDIVYNPGFSIAPDGTVRMRAADDA